ncbi:MAG: cysteine--tRNA ligase [Candidatus Krumholzibacteria bacterium]|jgi:cysteinyl-tRNA synthetase|nr:cysteine--tRNA ligase [Candidatus Krumholzibacteria bacterium]MDP6669976.1 cysteine--tRNA ligase [Candidatus Krumholzibacteria bacterium]MDP7022532.1 cysteine--tRNA ligase [Candidatus Krumholzibacteria bacterium]
MSLQIYDPIRKKKVEFQPVQEGKVGMYVCGMTVQGEPHIGHMLAALSGDMVRRYLEYRGYEVTLVQNFTDIDDKILQKAAEEGVDYPVIAQRNIDLYFHYARALNIADATVYPKATEHVPEMFEIIEKLIEKGHAYESNGDVYYDVKSYDDYGRLSGRRINELQSGVRIEVEEGKRDDLDFALWKSAPEEEPGFESPWGWGRPGWHIECSAMSMKYCGETLDIHGGGLDLKFPHHENERAQSQAATGKTFANHWLHNGLVTVGGEKMSKSDGNYVSMTDLMKDFEAETVRFYLLSTHFRSRAEFDRDQLHRAHGSLNRIREFSISLHESLEKAPKEVEVRAPVGDKLEAACDLALERWHEAMDDDFNTGGAIGHIFELVKEFNRLMAEDAEGLSLNRQALEKSTLALDTMCGALGLFIEGLPKERRVEISPELLDLLALRDKARAEKDWAAADRYRDEILAAGFQVLDGPEGSSLKKT